jgi:hypothetical protein
MTCCRPSIFRFVAVVIVAIFPLAAHAISPMTEEGVLCRGSYVFLGRVLAASYHDCRDCDPEHALYFKVYVSELLSRPNSFPSSRPGRELRLGEVIDVRSIKGEEEPSYMINRTVLSNEQLASVYVQKEFVFSIMMTNFELQHEHGPWVNFWKSSRKEWARATLNLRVEGCAAPL